MFNGYDKTTLSDAVDHEPQNGISQVKSQRKLKGSEGWDEEIFSYPPQDAAETFDPALLGPPGTCFLYALETTA